MSAYMVSKEHIDALVATAVYGPTDNARPAGYGQTRWYAIYFDNPSRRLDYESASIAGEILVKENLSSIHTRYPDTLTNPDNTPGPCEQYWLTEYAFPRDAKRLTTIQALKALACYEYQSCEHPEWSTSEAHSLCDRMRHNLIGCLPGYEDADWETAA